MRRIMIVGGLLCLMVGGFARPSEASWVGNNCSNYNTGDSHVKRSEAQAYAFVANDEGYEWGGGCWNDDDIDNTPNAPDSNGEGPDCSGLVFKTWEMVNGLGFVGFNWWSRLANMHGPYTSFNYHSPASGWPFYRLANKDRTTTLYMDAFAKDGHVGLLYTATNPSDNSDYIIEALGDAAGTGIHVETYRFDSRYVGVRRVGWTADCYPRCGGPASRSHVVVP
jgi:hypothetical protein